MNLKDQKIRTKVIIGATGVLALAGLGMGAANAVTPASVTTQSTNAEQSTPGDPADAPDTANETSTPGDPADASDAANDTSTPGDPADAPGDNGSDVQQNADHTDPADAPDTP
jgi:hypothetical protein